MFYRPKDGHGLPHDPFKAIIAPRPIGWVSTLDAEGRANLAPYSFFNGCGDHPPLVMFAQTGRKNGDEKIKDTIANVRETGEFACNIVSHALREKMNLTTAVLPAGEDEFSHAGLTKAPGIEIAAPHVAEAPAVLECKTVRILDDLPVFDGRNQNIMVIGEVVGVIIDEAHLVDGLMDVTSYNPVARMGYLDYTSVTDRWSMSRPK
ncbi:flavin reductase family protein [Rhodobacteraceae bacterium NNCM2]|nr:flavin reductase family protein [Coraliihabitans acroporae]